MAQLPRHPRIPKLNMSVSSAYFPIIFFSLVPSLLFNALLLAYPYHLLLVRGEQRDLILGLSMTLSSFLLFLLLLFLPFHPSFFLCPSHYPTTLRTERVASFIRCVHRFTARNGKNCSPLISINVYADKRGVNVIKLDRYVPNVSLLRSHSLMHHFIRLLTT